MKGKLKANSELHRNVVKRWVDNPNKPLHQIATDLNTTLSIVHNWTTKYLAFSIEERKKFLETNK